MGIFLLLSLGFLVLGTTGCASTKLVDISTLQMEGLVTSQARQWKAENGSITVNGSEIFVPGDVLAGDYDRTTNTLLVKFDHLEMTREARQQAAAAFSEKNPDSMSADRNRKRRSRVDFTYRDFVLYDLAGGRLGWATSKGEYNSYLNAFGVVYFNEDREHNLYSAADGTFIRKGEPGLYLTRDYTLVLNKDEYASVNLVTGEKNWVRPGSSYSGLRGETVEDGWAYIVADGLHAFNLETGEGWDFTDLKTDSRGVAAALAKDAALSCLAALGGGVRYGSTRAKLYHNTHSDPLIVDEMVYIADKEALFCFDKQTGITLWESPLPKEMNGLNIFEAGDSIALIGKGWRFVDYGIERDKNPMAALYDKETGEMTSSTELNQDSVFIDFLWADDSVLLLTPTSMFHLDSKLVLTGERAAEGGDFLRFITSKNGETYIRTSTGVLAIDSESMETLWSKDLGRAPFYISSSSFKGEWDRGSQWVRNMWAEVSRSHHFKGLYWLTTEDGYVQGIDLDKKGETVIEIDLGTDDFKFTLEAIVASKKNSVLVIPYNGVVN